MDVGCPSALIEGWQGFGASRSAKDKSMQKLGETTLTNPIIQNE